MVSTNADNSGILSGIFSFVSREFESFITNATGSEPSTSRVLLDDFVDSGFSREASPLRMETFSPRKYTRKSKQPRSDLSAKNEREAKSSQRKRIKQAVASSKEAGLPSECSQRSPRPRLSRLLKRRSSVPMPGSLFPRSPSLESDADTSAAEKEQRVRFDLHVSHTSDPQPHQGYEPSPSRPLDGSAPTSDPRRCFSSSVKAAVDKFYIGQDDADSSILLPSPKRSPHVLVASRNPQSRGVSTPSPPSRAATGNKRTSHSVESFSNDCGEISGIIHVKGKEKEPIAAREELSDNEHRDSEIPALSVEQVEYDHNRDKVRIRMLEEEIERLKQELSNRPVPNGVGVERGPLPPPPPPPPPPPLPKKILLSIPTTAPESHLFASVRASLKQAPPPVENPINPLIGRRTGQPTIGLAADKMAAFLSEMKTIRLRKVSERSSGDNPAPPSDRFGAQSVSRGSSSFRGSQPIPLPTSNRASNIDTSSIVSEAQTCMGEKRKRNTIHDDNDPPSKRRLRISSTDSNLAVGSNSDSSGILTEDISLSHSYPLPFKVTSKTWQSGSIADAPTPSLCSDNDIEREDVSLDDQPPSTPPASVGPSRNLYRFKGNGVPVGHESSREIHVGMNKTSYNTQGGQNFESSVLEVRSQHPRPNIFDKRLPSSPFPDKSPRRPRPPSRIPRAVPPSRQEDHSDEEDPLSLTFSSPGVVFPYTVQRRTASRSRVTKFTEPSTRSRDTHSPSLSSRSSSRAGRRSTSQVSRRRTLDEELRDIPYTEQLEDEAVHTGVGTRSKQLGFLAHGGAGGAPVFMGVGYVEAAEEDDPPRRGRY